MNHALIAAVDQRNTGIVRRLLHQGADPNAAVQPEDKRPVWQRLLDMLRRGSVTATVPLETALSKAIEWAPADNDFSYPYDKDATIRALIDAGADVNARYQEVDSNGENGAQTFRTAPLIAAEARRDWNTVLILLDHHANINATDDDGNSALMYASWSQDIEQVEALLKRGANVNVKNDHGETALFWIWHCAKPWRHGDMRAGSYLPDYDSIRAGIASLLRHGASINARDSEGKTVMQRAQGWQDKQLIQILKQAGAKE